MKLPHWGLLLFVFIARSPAAESVSWKDIGDKVSIMGKLGIPLGTAVEIEATVVEGSSLGHPVPLIQLTGTYCLKIESVAGTALAAQPIAFFESQTGDDDPNILPRNAHELHRLRAGTEATALTNAQRTERERDFVGQRFRLLVYESGVFDGYPPAGLPEEGFSFVQKRPDPMPQAGSKFHTTIYVLKILGLQK